VDEQGWMHTGDLATIDEDGYCNIVGRVKDLIIRGGENISPREIEELLYRHPQIQDVQVFGIPDRHYGEVVCAWIKLKSGEACDAESIRRFCHEQIAHFKVPQHIRFVDQFPMTVTGKAQKFLMREEMIKELHLSEEKTA
jgi:fatty-acyl-CoA synthase